MKVRALEVANILLMFAITIVLVGSAGCFYPKAERVEGELVSDVEYTIVDCVSVRVLWTLSGILMSCPTHIKSASEILLC